MSYSPPEPPSPERKSLDFDEFIAVVVALISIGFILLWGLTRQDKPFRTTTWPLLGKQPQGETAFSGKPSHTPSAELASREVSEQLSPLQIFQSQPDTPDKFAEFGNSANLSRLDGKLQSGLNQQAVRSFIVSAPAGLPSQTAPNIAIQPDGGELEPLFSVNEAANEAAAGSGGNLPDLPSQPLESTVSATIEPLTAPRDFPDISDEYWATDFIDALSARGLLLGFPDGTFQPDKPVTRAELAALIAKVFRREGQRIALEFGDIPVTHWAASEIDQTVTAGFMRGYPGEIFNPDQPVSRVQVLVAIVSGLGVSPTLEPTSSLERYQDQDEIPDWAIAKVATGTEIGLVVNYPSLERLQPNKPATRAEVAAILNRTLVYLGKLDDSPSNYIVRP